MGITEGQAELGFNKAELPTLSRRRKRKEKRNRANCN
jgi:hypothetical protein